jgi:hypothetical protein
MAVMIVYLQKFVMVDLPSHDELCALVLDDDVTTSSGLEAYRMASTLAVIHKAHPCQKSNIVIADEVVFPMCDGDSTTFPKDYVPAVPGWYVHKDYVRVNRTNLPMTGATSYHIAISATAMASSTYAMRFFLECVFLWRVPFIVTGHDTYTSEKVRNTYAKCCMWYTGIFMFNYC